MNLNEFNGPRSSAALRVGNAVLMVVVEHPDFMRVFHSCIDLIDTLRTLKMPSGILIQAEPGMGKSLLLQKVKAHLTRSAGMSREDTLLVVSLDSTVDTHKLAAAMTLALGYPALPSRPSLEGMNHMVDKGLERKRPLALLLDEMQHVCEGNRDITARAVTDWLKVRMDRYNLPVIGAGTRVLERLQTINPQFSSRASSTFVLSPFEFGEPWRQLLAGFATQIREINLEIVNGPIARPIHTASKGNLRALKRLLAYASMYAAERNGSKVMVEDFARAFEDTNGSIPDRINPFSTRIAHNTKG
ncbi:TniB family NTP-binding protein [Hydrogenophaga sp.]|uniref:TniB family NTP-binding protein n=1 Tax=Hydrogenophaga sp. TaxID=1904254 RepID=UPI0027374233|nr:TniB family NTP-binding protein [Hydrogenophaga sp.]MDP3883663.1 TniB family NTP-binding protein [Hydrogenophaga sp.]